ncbi:hypothetical protein [Corynebacterium sp. H130]|uniref:hypothetical protein n=1 Tax=Corynebacterium sp. H130 TaxID=3133444 RepID=UPI0030957858
MRKTIVSTLTLALALSAAPAAHAGFTAQNSSEAAQLSSEEWANVSSNMQWNLTNQPFPSNIVDAIGAGAFGAFQASLVSLYHWTFMSINQVLNIFNP